MSQLNSTFLPVLGGGHFGTFGYGGTSFPVTQDDLATASEPLAADDGGIRRTEAAPLAGYGIVPPYDGYLGPHVPGVCGYPGGFGGFDPTPPLSVPIMWAMRATPAIVLASNYLTFAPALSAPWSSDIADDGGDGELAQRVKAAHTQDLLPMWERAFPGALESLHFANWLQEIVWGRREDRGAPGVEGQGGGGYRIAPVDVRPVLPMEATLHQDAYLRFAGFQIGAAFRGPQYAFLAVNQPHLDPVRGYSRNQNALRDWWRAMQSERNADRTERKASGIHMMLGVPSGATVYTKPDGTKETIDAHTMAQRIANQAAAANVFTVPQMYFDRDSIKANPALADVKAVSVEKFDWGNIGEALLAHLKRLDRLDVNMVRAWYHGEREGMEAEHGSRADATAHKSGGVLDCENVRSMLAQQWDEQVGATWQRQNFPQWKGKIRTRPAPLSDPLQSFLQDVAKSLFTSPTTGPDTEAELNKRGLLERVSLPLVTPEDAAARRAAIAAKPPPAPPLDPNNVPVHQANGNGRGKMSPRVASALRRFNGSGNGANHG